ncbi:MAG TPA: hypothetical protein VF653_16580 [Methylomirabilota bacterium]
MKLTGTTFGETLGPAMGIRDQAEADDYFEQLVAQYMDYDKSRTRELAESIVRQNLGYYAGYYDHETMERVNRLFRTTHPIFGSTAPTPEEAFEAGKRFGERMKEER